MHCLQVGVFEMKEEGLVAVSNPSASFLGDRTLSANASSAVTVMIEGTRPLLLEVQALCSPVHQVSLQANGLCKRPLFALACLLAQSNPKCVVVVNEWHVS